MKSVAAELGISTWTVSMVINNNAETRGISAKTINRVQSFLDERGYVPSRQAVELRSGTQGKVGIIYHDKLYYPLVDTFNFLTARYAETPQLLETVVVGSGNLKAGIKELLARGVSTLIWIHRTSSQTELKEKGITNYLANFNKVIMYNYRFVPGDNSEELLNEGFYLVGVERLPAYSKAVSLLKSAGHKRIYFSYQLGRAELGDAIRTIIKDAGLDIFEQGSESPIVDSRNAGFDIAQTIITQKLKNNVTAAIIGTDEEAAYTMAELKKKKIKIPQDISIIGHGDMPIADIVSPALTTFRLPQAALHQALDNVINNDLKQKRNEFSMEFVERESHGNI